MPRLTKTEIEQRLLAGKPVNWKDDKGKPAAIILETAKQRRLLAYLLGSSVREVKGIQEDFVKGLAAAFIEAGDPASEATVAAAGAANLGPWKMHSIRIEGFGGVNAWKGKPFELALDGESLLIEGPNGSGKSSLTAAIIWTLSGERPRDQDEAPSDEAKPVFGVNDTKAGEWPPVATYPNDLLEILLGPSVSAEITFSNPAGTLAKATRTFDGKKMIVQVDPNLQIPPILLEAGLLMPARLPKLRFDQGKGRLSEAVQKLTGLDDLIILGGFIQNLCHKARDYLSYKNAELAAAKSDFDRQIEAARTALAPVAIAVPNFKPSDTDDANGDMAKLGKSLNDKATDLTKIVSDDLAPGLNLADAQVQKQIVLALAGAEDDVKQGIGALPTWKTLDAVLTVLGAPQRETIQKAIVSAQQALATAIEYHKRAEADTRYRLKAAAARWHADHGGGGKIDQCPTCDHSLEKNPELKKELAELQSAGEAATRKLSDNVIGIMADLEAALPQSMRRYLSDNITGQPRAALEKDIRAKLVEAERYAKYLTKFAGLVAIACKALPGEELTLSPESPETVAGTSNVLQRIARLVMLCLLAQWFEKQKPDWEQWWKTLAVTDPLSDSTMPVEDPETLTTHVGRLAKSLGEAEPFRLAAEAMRGAWKQGQTASKIEKEKKERQEIADALEPLKNLSALAESQARDALTDLSSRIGQIHKDTYLSDALQFQGATLEKKAGLVLRGKFSDEVRIDATLVANTSWLRGILWAFIFALREEAVEQLGGDPFPIMVLDDPQLTFDSEHRHRWAEQIAKLQKTAPGTQIILTTYDELFLSLLKIDGVSGRHALISSAGPELGHIGIFEGDELSRRWWRVQAEKTPKAAQDYMAAVRVFVEGMLKLMLRGEDVNAKEFLLGDSRDKLTVLHAGKLEPWGRKEFGNLAGALGKGIKEIKYIEWAHHDNGKQLAMAEAADVEKYWSKTLRPALERAFRVIREHRALHGGLTALHAMPPSAELPEGYKDAVRAIQLPLIGSAAALSDGRAADGCVHLHIDGTAKETVELKDHVVFRLTAATLEPVARPGDLLLVSEHAPPTAKSLVVAINEDRLLARRLEIADNHSDVAVLTANAINPRMIAPPVVAKLSTLSLRKLVGVIFDHGKTAISQEDGREICNCSGESDVKAAFANLQGIVEIDGHSAEPHALDKQFLMIAKTVPLAEALKRLEGQPVIAEDSNGSRYFKRFRAGGPGVIILESLEIGGGFPPIVLGDEPGLRPNVESIWPVLGVLFEKPK